MPFPSAATATRRPRSPTEGRRPRGQWKSFLGTRVVSLSSHGRTHLNRGGSRRQPPAKWVGPGGDPNAPGADATRPQWTYAASRRCARRSSGRVLDDQHGWLVGVGLADVDHPQRLAPERDRVPPHPLFGATVVNDGGSAGAPSAVSRRDVHVIRTPSVGPEGMSSVSRGPPRRLDRRCAAHEIAPLVKQSVATRAERR
jgi:hypothetical protein